eukprot:1128943-Pleurochrysis_carterae.AAC.1
MDDGCKPHKRATRAVCSLLEKLVGSGWLRRGGAHAPEGDEAEAGGGRPELELAVAAASCDDGASRRVGQAVHLQHNGASKSCSIP